jgi:hypothetical protein
VEGADVPGGNAVDGNAGTRWSSAFSDPQWITVDLGAATAINRVVLRWEAAFGRIYQVQVSANGTTWTTVRDVVNSDGGVDDHTALGATGRYVRINVTLLTFCVVNVNRASLYHAKR